MTLLPLTRPCLGLSITTDSVTLVEIRRKWRGRIFRRLAQESLPSDVIHLSPAKPNVTDIQAVQDALRRLVKGLKPPQPIVLSVPDLCARMAIFSFTSFPKKPLEREAILSWRFQQDLNLSTTNARLAYHVFEPPKAQQASSSDNNKVIRVFATAVQHTIIDQYEQACLQAGLLPLTVGLSGLDVFDLYRTIIQDSIRTASSRSHISSTESFFLYLANWGFTFLAIREGCPVFVRVKSLRFPEKDGPPAQPTHVEGASLGEASVDDSASHSASVSAEPLAEQALDEGKAFSPVVAMMIANELVATLQYYFESFPSSTRNGESLPLFFAEGTEQGASLLPDVHDVETMLKSSMADPPPLSIISLPDRLTQHGRGSSRWSADARMKALPAYASVMVA